MRQDLQLLSLPSGQFQRSRNQRPHTAYIKAARKHDPEEYFFLDVFHFPSPSQQIPPDQDPEQDAFHNIDRRKRKHAGKILQVEAKRLVGKTDIPDINLPILTLQIHKRVKCNRQHMPVCMPVHTQRLPALPKQRKQCFDLRPVFLPDLLPVLPHPAGKRAEQQVRETDIKHAVLIDEQIQLFSRSHTVSAHQVQMNGQLGLFFREHPEAAVQLTAICKDTDAGQDTVSSAFQYPPALGFEKAVVVRVKINA